MLEVVSKRKREAEALQEILWYANLADKEGHLCLEQALSGYPDQSIRILAAARSRDGLEKRRSRYWVRHPNPIR